MQSENPSAKDEAQSKPYRVRLPGFVADEAIGLGDVVSGRHTRSGSNPAADVSGAPRR